MIYTLSKATVKPLLLHVCLGLSSSLLHYNLSEIWYQKLWRSEVTGMEPKVPFTQPFRALE